MEEERRDDIAPEPKTSAQLIEEARNAFGVDSPSGEQASSDLMEQARDWLSAGQPVEAPDPMDPVVVDEPAIEEEVRRLLEAAPPSRPTATRSRRPTRTLPVPAPQTGQPARRRKRILGLAVVIGVVALLGNVSALLFSSDDSDTGSTPEPMVTVSEGSISSATDPCSGASVAGDLEAVISYLDGSDASVVDVKIVGQELVGSDGSTYYLELLGSTTGDPGQAEFVFVSDSMVMTRNDGVEITDTATLTVSFDGPNATDWSYTTDGPACGA